MKAASQHNADSVKTPATVSPTSDRPFGFDQGVMAQSIIALMTLIQQMLKNETEQQTANGEMGTYAASLAENKARYTEKAGQATADAGTQAMISGLSGAGASLIGAGVGIGMGVASGRSAKGLETEAQSDRNTLDKLKEKSGTVFAGTLTANSTTQDDLTAIDDFTADLRQSRSTSGIARVTTSNGPKTLDQHIANIRNINNKLDNGAYSVAEETQIRTRIATLKDKLDSNSKSYVDRIKSKTGKWSTWTNTVGQFTSTSTSIGSSVSGFLQANGQKDSASHQADASRNDAALNFLKGTQGYYDQATQKTVKQIGDLYAMLANISNSAARMGSSVS